MEEKKAPPKEEEDAGHTVELEALPGGNSDDPTAETEPDPERD
jgi:hypothetical protein